MRTSVTELGDARVRVEVGIEADAVQDRLERAAQSMAREMRMPGFRKGKVPPQLVIQRVGREAVLEQALRDSLPEWYERALLDAGITPVGDPELNVAALPRRGRGALVLDRGLPCGPGRSSGEYKGLEVGRAEAEVPDDAIQAELDRLREGFASLDPVDRPAAEGDLVVIDYSGTVDGEPFEGSEATDLMVELGAESLLPEFDRGPGGRGGHGRGHGGGPISRRPPAREPGRQAGELRGHRQGGPGEEASGPGRRVRRRGVGVRDAG